MVRPLVAIANIVVRFAAAAPVIPAEAGIQFWKGNTRFSTIRLLAFWIPAYAGMTKKRSLLRATAFPILWPNGRYFGQPVYGQGGVNLTVLQVNGA